MKREPLETLAACHSRIELELNRLEELAIHVAGRGLDATARSMAAEAVRFFDATGARHHEDEDGDLLPLLRRRAAALGGAEIAAAIDELEREHGTMEAQWHALRRTLQAIGKGRDATFDADEVLRFAWLYRRHLERENLLVLPFAREVLTASEREELSKRMAARRSLVQ